MVIFRDVDGDQRVSGRVYVPRTSELWQSELLTKTELFRSSDEADELLFLKASGSIQM